MNQKMIDRLKADEGCRLKPYVCTAGKLTIGIGRNLEDRGLTQEECDYLFKNDLDREIANVLKYIPWSKSLDDMRFGVLVNMAFNLGINGLLKFRNFLDALEAGHYGLARLEMLNSKWAIQLPERSKRLAEIIFPSAKK